MRNSLFNSSNDKIQQEKGILALERKHVKKSGTYLTGRAYSGMQRSWPESVIEKRRKGRPTTTTAKLALDKFKQH